MIFPLVLVGLSLAKNGARTSVLYSGDYHCCVCFLVLLSSFYYSECKLRLTNLIAFMNFLEIISCIRIEVDFCPVIMESIPQYEKDGFFGSFACFFGGQLSSSGAFSSSILLLLLVSILPSQ